MVIKGCNSRKGDITRPGYRGGDAGAIWPRGAEPSGFHVGGVGGRKWSKEEEGHVLTRRPSDPLCFASIGCSANVRRS